MSKDAGDKDNTTGLSSAMSISKGLSLPILGILIVKHMRAMITEYDAVLVEQYCRILGVVQ